MIDAWAGAHHRPGDLYEEFNLRRPGSVGSGAVPGVAAAGAEGFQLEHRRIVKEKGEPSHLIRTTTYSARARGRGRRAQSRCADPRSLRWLKTAWRWPAAIRTRSRQFGAPGRFSRRQRASQHPTVVELDNLTSGFSPLNANSGRAAFAGNALRSTELKTSRFEAHPSHVQAGNVQGIGSTAAGGVGGAD